MWDLILPWVIFVASLAVLIGASEFFTNAAERLGILLGLPQFIIGVTIVSIGTSLPELLSSMIAVTQDSSEVVLGNVLGSNIANILLVIGIASLVNKGPIRITYDLVSVDLPLFVGSTLLLILALWDQEFSLGEATLFLLGYLVYLFYIIRNSREEVQMDDSSFIDRQPSFLLQQILLIALSAALLYFGAKYTVKSLIQISSQLHIGKEILAVTAVALGTSLPELIVSIKASLKGNGEMAVGNVLGSNIFNIFVVMAVPSFLGPLKIPESIMSDGAPTLISGTLLLFFVAQDRKLTIWEGWLFLIFYVWFIGKTYNVL